MKKRNVHAGSKHTRKSTSVGQNATARRQRKLPLEHALEVSNRRARVAELAASGVDLRQCEQLLKQEGFRHTDHSTLSRDLKQAREQLNQSTLGTVKALRDLMQKKLLALETKVRERDFRTGWDDPSCTRDLLAIYAQLSKLLGLNADTRLSVVAAADDGIPPEKMIPWRRWLWETRHVPESSLDQIWELCKKLAEPPTAETTALWVPPADSPLWHDSEDEDEKEPN